ncbi:MAG: hypothetical protein P9M03_08935 [Candidatus Theseobacter exili]|nr:hypothetical protein [Candidatus Theseobacter exili]
MHDLTREEILNAPDGDPEENRQADIKAVQQIAPSIIQTREFVFARYEIYFAFIDAELGKVWKRTPEEKTLTRLSILENYIFAYKIKKVPAVLRKEEQKRIIKYIKEYNQRRVEEINEEKKKNIPEVVKTQYPKDVVRVNDKISFNFFKNNFPEGEPLFVELAKGSPYGTTAIIEWDALNIKTSKVITAYDRDVHDAIVSLYLAENKAVTPLMIYRVMTGSSEATLLEAHNKKIAASINRLESCIVYLDTSKEKFADPDTELLELQGRALQITRAKIKHKGNINTWFRIDAEPILYEFARYKNHIVRIFMNNINTPVRKTPKALIIQNYLERRIARMKNSTSKNTHKTIRYKSIFEQINLNLADVTSSERQDTRAIINKMLTYWKQEKFIKGFTENKNTRHSVISITIRP